MPKIEETPRPTWNELRDLVMISIFNSPPVEEEQLKKEIKILIEEERKHVCETDKRNND